ncbi:MAG: hypothetical protein IJ792_05605 [Oscillospiraceae bacterium]|nr:hypothetical protein [Oscillospiraceae bacterium]
MNKETTEASAGKKKGKGKIILIVIAIIVVIAAVSSNSSQRQQPNEAPAPAQQDTAQIEAAEEAEPQGPAEPEEAPVTEEEPEEPETPEETEESEAAVTYPGGMYKIGTDMPAGVYLVEAGWGGMEYIEVAKDSTGTLDSIISNDNFSNRTYIEVSDGQYLKFGGTATPAEEAPAYVSDGLYPDGQYLVGKDIPAGEYRVSVEETGLGYGYIEISKDATGTLNSIISNDIIETDIYQTLKEGQYVKLSGAYINAE